MNIELATCCDCDAVYDGYRYPQECPVCKLKKDLDEKLEELHDLIRNFHPLE